MSDVSIRPLRPTAAPRSVAAPVAMAESAVSPETTASSRSQPHSEAATGASGLPWWGVGLLATASAVLYVLALPPWDQVWAGWLAPIGWLGLAAVGSRLTWRHYGMVYLTSLLMWMGVFYFLTMPHPAGYVGWVLIGVYFGIYPVAFVALTREMVHRWRWPLVAAGPIVWVASELFRGHALTGLSMASLGHSQYRVLPIIQVADLGGAYAVAAVMVLAAAGGVAAVTSRSWASRIGQPLTALALLGAALGYGAWRLATPAMPPAGDEPLTALLIQGSIDTQFGPEATPAEEQYEHYVGLTRQARAAHPDATVVLWPEGMIPWPLIVDREGRFDFTPDDYWIRMFATGYDPHRPESPSNHRAVTLITGTNTLVVPHLPGRRPETAEEAAAMPRPIAHYNTAAQFDPTGTLDTVYHKRHLVMFGEYLPLAELAPIVYYLSPMARPCSSGPSFTALTVGRYTLAPTICFESMVPQLVGEQIRTLTAAGSKPDALVNLTNDGWFFGANALDLHLASNVFRAVEHRTPVLVAANTGFSAHIDGNGQILDVGPRREPGFLRADVVRDPRTSFYTAWGDLLPIVALLISLAAATTWVARKATGRS